MFIHPPPVRKKEVNMNRLEFTACFETAKLIVDTLDIPPDIKDKIKNALDQHIQSVMKNSKT